MIDYHVMNGIPIGDAVDTDLQGVCDKLVQSGIMLEPQFMNELYKFIIYLESVKATTDNSDSFIQTINPRYIEAKKQFQDIYLEIFIKMMLMNTNRIILSIRNSSRFIHTNSSQAVRLTKPRRKHR